MSAWDDLSTSDRLFGVGRPDAWAVGRSGGSYEAPCWWNISFVASPYASIDTIAALSNGRLWRWGISRDVLRSTRVSPRVLLGILMFSSYSNSWLTRGGSEPGSSTLV